MNTNMNFAEQVNVMAFPPIDLAGAAGLATPYVSMKNYSRATILLCKAAIAGTDHPIITLDQATALAGTGTKPLLSITRIHKKTHATTLETQGTWTLVEQAVDDIFTGDGAVEALYAIDVKAEDLDVDNGFDCFRATIADTGAAGAQLGSLLCLLWGARYTVGLSPLVD